MFVASPIYERWYKNMINQDLFDFILTAHDINAYTVSGRIQWWVRALSFSAAGAFFILWRLEYYPFFSLISGIVCGAVWVVFVIIHIVQVVRELRELYS